MKITDAVRVLDVRNNPLFLPGKLVVPPNLAPPPLALWNGDQFGVLPYTRCNGYAHTLFALLGYYLPIMTANQYAAWFPTSAAWREVKLPEATELANAEKAVAIVAAEQPHGHIGVGVPNPTNPTVLFCTAAGAANTPLMRFVDQFGQLAQVAHFYTPKEN